LLNFGEVKMKIFLLWSLWVFIVIFSCKMSYDIIRLNFKSDQSYKNILKGFDKWELIIIFVSFFLILITPFYFNFIIKRN
jgi:hypothetical protein